MRDKTRLIDIAKVFFKLGLFAFGGPAAHIAMMEAEVVTKRKWMTRSHYLDLIGATNLIPGPNSTEMTMHCGHERGGTPGLFIAGLSFIIPAIFITGFLAWSYVEYGNLPEVTPFIIGIKPAVLAIIASAVYKLGKKALKGAELMILGVIVLILNIIGIDEIIALFSAGLLGMIYFYSKNKKNTHINSFVPFIFIQSTSLSITKLSTIKVFLIFLKVGSILYGSGYVLFAYLDSELVETGYMTRQALLDAIAVGQFTPGPVLSTATFIGYQLDGFSGAIVASAGIFFPSFIFVLILNPFISRMRKSKLLGYFLDSVNAAAVAIMAGVLVTMTIETVQDWRTLLITLLSVIAVFKFKKISVMWTILGGSILGYLLFLK